LFQDETATVALHKLAALVARAEEVLADDKTERS
jgi:hypothetical protein